MRIAPHVDFRVEADAHDDETTRVTVNGHQIALIDPRDAGDLERVGRIIVNELIDLLYSPKEGA